MFEKPTSPEEVALLEKWVAQLEKTVDMSQLYRVVDLVRNCGLDPKEAAWLVRVTKSEKAVAA